MQLADAAYDMPTGLLLHEAQRQHAMAEITRDSWQQVLYERGTWFLLLVWAERTCGVLEGKREPQWVAPPEGVRWNIRKIIIPPGYMIDGDALQRDGTLQFIATGGVAPTPALKPTMTNAQAARAGLLNGSPVKMVGGVPVPTHGVETCDGSRDA